MKQVLEMFKKADMCVIVDEYNDVETPHTLRVDGDDYGITFEVLFNGAMLIDEENIDDVTIIDSNTLELNLTKGYGIEGTYILKLYKSIK